MDLTNRKTIKELLVKYGATAEKKFGQHFILSKKALAQMITAAEIKKDDTIIEIGPGLGTLTQELAKTGAKIIAVEKDLKMINILKETLADYKNIKIVQADARLSIPGIDSFGGQKRASTAFDGRKSAQEKIRNQFFDRDEAEKYIEDFQLGITLDKKIQKNGYKIVANLPYNVATFLIRSWLEMKSAPEQMVLMIQKEVAQRICAKPPHMNLLAVNTQFLATVKIIGYVPAEAFWPKPKVNSAIIKIVPRIFSIFNGASFACDRKQMIQIVKAGFSQPRKQLIGNLAKKLNIPKEKLLPVFRDLDISEKARAENLSLEQWISLATSLHLTTQRK